MNRIMIDPKRQPAYDPDEVRRYLSAGLWRDEVLGDWLRRNAERFPDRAAVVGDDGSLTWSEAWSAACRLASSFEGLGLRRGDVIAVQLPNTPDFLVAYFAIALIALTVRLSANLTNFSRLEFAEMFAPEVATFSAVSAIVCTPLTLCVSLNVVIFA